MEMSIAWGNEASSVKTSTPRKAPILKLFIEVLM